MEPLPSKDSEPAVASTTSKNFLYKRRVEAHADRPKFAIIMRSRKHKYDYLFVAEYDSQMGELVTVINRQTINSILVVNEARLLRITPLGLLQE